MALTAPTEESSEIAFEKHFNPALKYDSQYYKSLNSLIKCVEKNANQSLSPEQQNEVCSNEMKQVRIDAFKKELLYHNVNKRFFMNLVTMKRHEAPFWHKSLFYTNIFGIIFSLFKSFNHLKAHFEKDEYNNLITLINQALPYLLIM